jgi:hypothetical protein
MIRTIFIAPPDGGGGLDPVNMGPAVAAGTISALEGFPQAGQNLTPSPIGAPHALQNPAIVISPHESRSHLKDRVGVRQATRVGNPCRANCCPPILTSGFALRVLSYGF